MKQQVRDLTTVYATLSLAVGLCFCGTPAVAAEDPNQELVQISTINALISGIYEGDTTIGELLELGSFGIGTINNLDGEMVALDGQAYQVTSTGSINVLPKSAKTPFASVTHFHADTTTAGVSTDTMEELQELIDRGLPSENLFYAVRITGTFPSMKVRSVTRQEPPYRRLTEVVKEQSLFSFSNTSGTLVGFRCPEYVQGVNVANYHLHYLSADKKQGGHVLGFELEDGTVQVDTLPNFRLLLPDSGAFMKTDLSEKNEDAIHAVEKLRAPTQ
jgi:acetolactate decarboxylase